VSLAGGEREGGEGGRRSRTGDAEIFRREEEEEEEVTDCSHIMNAREVE